MGQFRIDPWVWFLWALMMLVLPLNWLGAAVAGAVWHELCHYLVLLALGGRGYALHMGIWGVRMDTSPLTPGKELLCALAGPVGSILLSGLSPIFPRTALCALVQGLFNLLPVFPLDGGRILRCFCLLFFPAEQLRICRWAEILAVSGVAGGCLWAAFRWDLGFSPVIFPCFLFARGFLRKNTLHCGQSGGTIVLP